MTVLRVMLGAVGGLLTVLGVRSLLNTGREDIVDATWWLAGGVIAHDLVLAPLTVLLALLATRLPGWAQGATAAGFLVLGSVTLLALPVLGRFGATADNPTLLDRDYRAGWLVFAAIVVAGAAVWAAVERHRGRPRVAGTTDGRGAAR
jgi:hypothetical protein